MSGIEVHMATSVPVVAERHYVANASAVVGGKCAAQIPAQAAEVKSELGELGGARAGV